MKHAQHKSPLKVGTVFEDSPISLQKWLPAVWMIVASKNGISSYEVSRALGITQKSAWFMMHRTRAALSNGSLEKIGGKGHGPVEVDKTLIGGKPKNMRREKRLKLKKAEFGGHKVIVMGMLDRETRKVPAKVIPNAKRDTLQKHIMDNVEKRSTVYTDGWAGYDELRYNSFIHATVNHLEEYVRARFTPKALRISGAYSSVD